MDIVVIIALTFSLSLMITSAVMTSSNLSSTNQWSQIQTAIIPYQAMTTLGIALAIGAAIMIEVNHPEMGSIVTAILAALAFGLSTTAFAVATISR